jgi:hypothetical protein
MPLIPDVCHSFPSDASIDVVADVSILLAKKKKHIHAPCFIVALSRIKASLYRL